MIEVVGLIAAIVLPFWNIPLILRIQRRRSSNDISMLWAVGVFVCLLLMLPSGLISADRVYRVFTMTNIVMFGAVVVQIIRYR